MPQKIVARLNHFGHFLAPEDLERLEQPLLDAQYGFVRDDLARFFDRPWESIGKPRLQRYIELCTIETHMVVTPHTEAIHARILAPLRSAKRSYCDEEYLSTIALCGLAGEMLSLLVWKLSTVSLKGRKISPEQEQPLFGEHVESLKHGRRCSLLKTLELITGEQEKEFTTISKVRNDLLHGWLPERGDLRKEARRAFLSALRLFKGIAGVELADAGTVKVTNPLLLQLFADVNAAPPGAGSEGPPSERDMASM